MIQMVLKDVDTVRSKNLLDTASLTIKEQKNGTFEQMVSSSRREWRGTARGKVARVTCEKKQVGLKRVDNIAQETESVVVRPSVACTLCACTNLRGLGYAGERLTRKQLFMVIDESKKCREISRKFCKHCRLVNDKLNHVETDADLM